MSSGTAASKPVAGKGIFIALIPWVLFTVLAERVSVQAAALIALAAAVVIAARGVRSGHPKLLELAAVATFVAFAIAAFAVSAGSADWLERYARAIAAGVLALIAFGSLLSVPFTEQYAREVVPQEAWSSPRFKAINRELTTVWACVFAGMVPSHIAGGAIDTTRGNLIFNWAIPIALVVYGAKRTTAVSEEAAPPPVATPA
jgi:hypothetical protein